jgi:hypothetical protein
MSSNTTSISFVMTSTTTATTSVTA